MTAAAPTVCTCGAPSTSTRRATGERLCTTCATALMRAAQRGERCILCGAPPTYIGVFVPDDPRIYGARHGGATLVRYAICARCHAMPDCAERVEIILAHATGAEGAA